jgi:hypothetical protein
MMMNAIIPRLAEKAMLVYFYSNPIVALTTMDLSPLFPAANKISSIIRRWLYMNKAARIIAKTFRGDWVRSSIYFNIVDYMGYIEQIYRHAEHTSKLPIFTYRARDYHTRLWCCRRKCNNVFLRINRAYTSAKQVIHIDKCIGGDLHKLYRLMYLLAVRLRIKNPKTNSHHPVELLEQYILRGAIEVYYTRNCVGVHKSARFARF